MTSLPRIVAFLDRELNLEAFRDLSNNGLQVENSGRIRRVCAGVDASQDFFERAAAWRADLLICHHGLSWGDSLKHITKLNYRRLKFLLDNDMALYACHLPLDAHPRLGNNAQICKALKLQSIRPFGAYHGMTIGFRGRLPGVMSFKTFKKLTAGILGRPVMSMDFGKTRVRTVAVMSGAASDEIAEAGEAGIDVYLSGEPGLPAWSLAREYGINAVFGGHYATEVFGVRAAARLLARRFAVTAGFIDLEVPL